MVDLVIKFKFSKYWLSIYLVISIELILSINSIQSTYCAGIDIVKDTKESKMAPPREMWSRWNFLWVFALRKSYSFPFYMVSLIFFSFL